MNILDRTAAIRALDQLGPTSTDAEVADQLIKVAELSLGRALMASDLESIAESHDSLAKEFRRRAMMSVTGCVTSSGGAQGRPS